MGQSLCGPDQRRAEADRQNAVGSQRPRDASAPGQGRAAVEGADERGQSAGWRDEENREPVRIQLDEYDQKGAGAEISRIQRRQDDARQKCEKENREEQIARSAPGL